jgi:hypothetical protein
MKKCRSSAILLAIALLFILWARGQEASQVNKINVILFDVSRSMIGEGDGMGIDIFVIAKNAAIQTVENMDLNTHLIILPFDRGLKPQKMESSLRSPDDVKKTIDFIDHLNVEGVETWLTRSYEDAVKIMADLKSKFGDLKDKELEILIFTDGHGNHALDVDIDNFIKIYDLRRVDFPHLFTKFYSYRKTFSDAEIKKLEEHSIPVNQVVPPGPNPPKQIIVTLDLDKVFIYSNKPSFDLGFKFQSGLVKELPVNAQITSETASKCGAKFELSPSDFVLSESQKKKFDVSVRAQIDVLKWMKQNHLDQIDGKFVLSSSNGNVVFHPQDEIDFAYAVEPSLVKVKFDKKTALKNAGDISLEFESTAEGKIEVQLTPEVENVPKNIGYQVNPGVLEFEKKAKKKIDIRPTNEKELRSFRKTLKATQAGAVLISLESKIPNMKIEPQKVKVPITITKYFNPFPYIAAVLIVICAVGVLLLVVKIKTAYFPKGATLTDSNGKAHRLEARFGKSGISIGRDKKCGIKCYKLSEKGELARVVGLKGSTKIRVERIKAVLKDSAGNVRDSLECSSGDYFQIEDKNGNSEIYVYQKI